MTDNALFSDWVLTVGSLDISKSVLTSAGVTLLLVVLAYVLTRRMTLHPGMRQSMLEGIVGSIEDAVADVQPDYARQLTPLIGTLWIFLVVSNLTGLIPGLESPTRDLSVTSALAIIVFFSVHWYGIRANGLRQYLRHYLSPSPLLLPFHIISELTRTLALAVRLFGNIMSLEIAALLVLMVAGFLAPVPLLMLHIVEALVQAYIFGVLALIYVASAIQTQQEHIEKHNRKKGTP
ncbi:F0F1 ATP synthase subunit A [Aestuariibacter halophilus]|uniref:ATP synthase subunit a n=1 Tax=Fluctibacter halophilus TaxID=226011 RepID=A0ABS8GAM2_9ALTE|nr:F0F1 ATP synthase subunit A [Aestuariibacter halophilus]MCC2616860.1 F0F1 ATP synthase subunit A [Aestuariibacter halophilus]